MAAAEAKEQAREKEILELKLTNQMELNKEKDKVIQEKDKVSLEKDKRLEAMEELLQLQARVGFAAS